MPECGGRVCASGGGQGRGGRTCHSLKHEFKLSIGGASSMIELIDFVCFRLTCQHRRQSCSLHTRAKKKTGENSSCRSLTISIPTGEQFQEILRAIKIMGCYSWRPAPERRVMYRAFCGIAAGMRVNVNALQTLSNWTRVDNKRS
jgi:hypothetical protein